MTKNETTADKVDKILTNKVAGIIIFAAVMFGVFWISQTALGPLIAGLAGGIHRNVPEMGSNFS